jgi:hypothetical protein
VSGSGIEYCLLPTAFCGQTMAFIIDDILFAPLKFTIWLGSKLRDAAIQEMTDESRVHEELLQLQMRYEMEEISDEEYEKEEAKLMERLEAIREIKEEL